MKKDILIKYRDNRQEFDLLEALESRGLSDYDEEYKKLLRILFTMLCITNDNYLVIQQFLFKSIYIVLDDILYRKESRDYFIKIISESIPDGEVNITSFVSRFILNIKDNVELIGEKKFIRELEESLQLVNVNALDSAIKKEKSHEIILNVFYNCISDMESDRKVILRSDAISLFLEYIKKKPTDYLSHFIRPYYTGPNEQNLEYFMHVGEPFCAQVFPIQGEFKEYLEGVKDDSVDKKLIEDVRLFFERTSTRSDIRDKTLILYSPEMPTLINKGRVLELKSKKHEYVRGLCIPPDYKKRENER